MFALQLTQAQDAGVLRHSALDELCEPLHQEPEALGPAAVSVGGRRGPQQAGSQAGRAGAGMSTVSHVTWTVPDRTSTDAQTINKLSVETLFTFKVRNWV